MKNRFKIHAKSMQEKGMQQVWDIMAKCIVDAERHRRTPWTLAHWMNDIVSMVSACFRDLCIIYHIGPHFFLLQ